MPKITIILPVYNGGNYLKLSVASVLQQQFTDFEFLIIDDCSTDNSWLFLQELKDSRIKLFKNEKNKGLFYNLNFLINQATSSLIKIWTQDDIMYPFCLQKVFHFHELHSNIGFSYSERDYIDEAGNLLSNNKIDNTPEIVNRNLHTHIAFITGSIAGNIANVALNKHALDAVGLFNEKMKISGDFEMWVRLAKDYDIGFIKTALIQLRNHKGQLSGQERYYIYHLIEDIETYQLLFAYISPEAQKNGRLILRNKKLLFYYTLMIKAFLKGKFFTGFRFFKLLSSFDKFHLLTWSFFKNKFLKINSIT